jgi:hypothetical protein
VHLDGVLLTSFMMMQNFVVMVVAVMRSMITVVQFFHNQQFHTASFLIQG